MPVGRAASMLAAAGEVAAALARSTAAIPSTSAPATAPPRHLHPRVMLTLKSIPGGAATSKRGRACVAARIAEATAAPRFRRNASGVLERARRGSARRAEIRGEDEELRASWTALAEQHHALLGTRAREAREHVARSLQGELRWGRRGLGRRLLADQR